MKKEINKALKFLLFLLCSSIIHAASLFPSSQGHFSTIVYGHHYIDDNGLVLMRVRNAVNIVHDGKSWIDFDVRTIFTLNEEFLADGFFRIGAFADFNKKYDARSVDNGYYMLFTSDKQGKSIIVGKKEEGAFQNWEGRPFSWETNNEYEVRLRKEGSTLQFYLDGEEIYSAVDDSSFSRNPLYPSFRLHGLQVTVKSVEVRDPTTGKTLLSDVFTKKKDDNWFTTEDSAKYLEYLERPADDWVSLDIGMEHFKVMNEDGLSLASSQILLDEFWQGADKYDFSVFDGNIKMLQRAAPDSKILIRLILRCGWWRQQYPDELQVVYASYNQQFDQEVVKIVGPNYCPYSFASTKWRIDFGNAVAALVTHINESEYSDVILGYQLMAGDGGEWTYGFRNISDYSVPQKKAFREFTKQKYDGDIALLRRAWKKPEITFDSIQIPTVKQRLTGNCGVFLDPSESLYVADYCESYSNTIVDAIQHFARLVKHGTGGEKLVGAYYGYYFMPGNKAADYHNTGHRAFRKLLKNEDVDFIGAPEQYYGREHGGSCISQTLPESIRLHDKIFMNEDDTRTSIVPALWPGFPPPYEDTIDHSVGVLLRNAGSVATRANSLQLWMEMGANWFNHPQFRRAISKTRKIAEKCKDRLSASEIAVVVSEESFFYLTFSNALTYPLFSKMPMDSIAKVGAPFDSILLKDLDVARDYKLYIFLNAFYLTPEDRKLIAEKVMAQNKTVLWMYAPGFLTQEGFSLDAMQDLTGIDLALHAEPAEIGLESNGVKMFPVTKIAPVFYSCDDTAENTGKIISPTQDIQATPLLAKRKFQNWTSIWCGVPFLPAVTLREIAVNAGVHIYSDQNDSVYTNGELLVVHWSSDGHREIKLPERYEVTDALNDSVITPHADFFQADLLQGQTGLWWLRK